MIIIFLDIDGVLNSLSFYERTNGGPDQFDPENLVLLKKLVEATDARLVLTSSWRTGWDRQEEKCGEDGQLLNQVLGEYGLQIMDKTGSDLRPYPHTRCREILKWLRNMPEPVRSFVILDDAKYDWKKYGLESFLVQTDFKKDGFNASHLPQAIEILKNPPVSVKKLLFLNFIKGNFR